MKCYNPPSFFCDSAPSKSTGLVKIMDFLQRILKSLSTREREELLLRALGDGAQWKSAHRRMRGMKLSALWEGAEFFSPCLYKNSSLNALNENKRIRRMQMHGMKLNAFEFIALICNTKWDGMVKKPSHATVFFQDKNSPRSMGSISSMWLPLNILALNMSRRRRKISSWVITGQQQVTAHIIRLSSRVKK